MNSVRQSCRPKHQVLVLKCYPRYQKGVQTVTPNSSELSYLLYYASTRRSKLQKVGAFLEKRAARDVWRVKLGNVQVTLQILTALMEKLPRDLPLYARYVLTIIDTVLLSHDISMVEETISVFEVFCARQDSATLAVEHDYINQYREVVRKYSSFASTDPSSISKTPLAPPVLLRYRMVGLQAIKSVVGSELLGLEGSRQLNIMMPVILANIYTDGEAGLSPLQQKALSSEKQEREHTRRRRVSIATVQTVDTIDANPLSSSMSAADADRAAEIEARVLALRCLAKIFTPGSNKVQIRLAAALVFQFIVGRCHRTDNVDEKDRGNKETWATELLKLFVNWIPVQDRFIILVTLLDAVVERPLVDGQLEPQLALVCMMEWLLQSPINLIGLSVIDVLLSLLRYIRLVLYLGGSTTKLMPQVKKRPFVSALPEMNDPAGSNGACSSSAPPSRDGEKPSSAEPMKRELLDSLIKCIGNLATHIYYSDQITDMIAAVVYRIKPPASTTVSSDEADGEAESEKNFDKKLSPHEDSSSETYFTFATGHAVALRAIKEILVVANAKHPVSGGGAGNSRSAIPIQTWEGTQWLLRDPDRDTRYAYVAALSCWLRHETNENDLMPPPESLRISKLGSKRDTLEPVERSVKRVISTVAQNDKAATTHTSRFLQLLHFATFVNVTSDPSLTLSESDAAVTHLLLWNLVHHMGVNSIRFGLPIMMSLQEYYRSSHLPPRVMLRIGSLVHGYLCAIVKKFDLEETKVGNEILDEITRRRENGIWLDKVQFPPLSATEAASPLYEKTGNDTAPVPDAIAYDPFTSLTDLVSEIDNGYNESFASPPASPELPPGRGHQGGHHGRRGSIVNPRIRAGSLLPQYIKEQMQSPFSREACIAAIENEKAKSASQSGSKTGGSAIRSRLVQIYKNENSSTYTDSSNGKRRAYPQQQQHEREKALSALYGQGRRQSIPDTAQASAPGSSSKESTVRVNELRRVLSMANTSTSNIRHSSPLRARFRPGSASSSDSLVTDNLSTTSDADTTVERRKTNDTSDGEEEEDDIPPVPPLPPSLVLPGGFPTDSRSTTSAGTSPSRSPVRMDRPSTAPSQQQTLQPSEKRRTNRSSSTVRQSRSLSRKRSGKEPSRLPQSRQSSQAYDYFEVGSTSSPRENTSWRSVSVSQSFRRVDVDRLLGNIDTGEKIQSQAVYDGQAATPRRGIGAPPY